MRVWEWDLVQPTIRAGLCCFLVKTTLLLQALQLCREVVVLLQYTCNSLYKEVSIHCSVKTQADKHTISTYKVTFHNTCCKHISNFPHIPHAKHLLYGVEGKYYTSSQVLNSCVSLSKSPAAFAAEILVVFAAKWACTSMIALGTSTRSASGRKQRHRLISGALPASKMCARARARTASEWRHVSPIRSNFLKTALFKSWRRLRQRELVELQTFSILFGSFWPTFMDRRWAV